MGGGIGGLTAAIALSRLGIDVHLYEQATELREVGAGIAIASNALRALDAIDSPMTFGPKALQECKEE